MMNSKGFVITCAITIILALGFVTGVQADDDEKMLGKRCNPGGLWFGFPMGQPPFKVVSILPVNNLQKRYIITAEDQDPGVTPFQGEMVRVKKNQFKLWGMQYMLIGPETYGYMVISGDWCMSDCNTAEAEYLVSIYATDPFYEGNPVLLGIYPGVVNQYERMPQFDDSSGF